MKKAIATMMIGDPPDYWKTTRDSILSYAEQHKYPLVVIDHLDPTILHDDRAHWKNLMFQKFQMYDLLDHFDRIAYLDADMLVRPDAPDIFDATPATHIGAWVSGPYTSKFSQIQMDEIERVFGNVNFKNKSYFHAGMFVVSRCHRDMFDHQSYPGLLSSIAGGNYDMDVMNYIAWKKGFFVNPLSPKWCHCYLDEKSPWVTDLPDELLWKNRRNSYIVHYCGKGKNDLENDAREIREKYGIMPTRMEEISVRSCSDLS